MDKEAKWLFAQKDILGCRNDMDLISGKEPQYSILSIMEDERDDVDMGRQKLPDKLASLES